MNTTQSNQMQEQQPSNQQQTAKDWQPWMESKYRLLKVHLAPRALAGAELHRAALNTSFHSSKRYDTQQWDILRPRNSSLHGRPIRYRHTPS